jgi:hypothetical protein
MEDPSPGAEPPLVIPPGTGCIEYRPCKGVRYEAGGKSGAPLAEAVEAQIVTYANGVRRVCCLYAKDHSGTGEYRCVAGGEPHWSSCKYAWRDPHLPRRNG